MLKSWNCTEELVEECRARTFNWTDFTDAIYLSFCDIDAFQQKCYNKIRSLVGYGEIQWEGAITSIDPLKLHDDDLLDPCVQAAVYMNGEDRFVEVLKYNLNNCHMVWSGFDDVTLERRQFSTWMLLPLRCQIMICIGIVILLFLVILGFIVNFLVVWIIYVTTTLRHSQHVFRASIAISDCLQSIAVYPFMLNHYFTQIHLVPKSQEISLPLSDGNNSTTLIIDKIELFDQQYVDVMGVITHWTTIVSVYTLIVATADRLYAVMCPLKYRINWTAEYSARTVLVLWVVSFVISMVPVFTKPYLTFAINAQVMVMFVGDHGFVIYAFLAGVPMVLLWVLSIMTFVTIKRSGRRFKKKSVGKNKTEIRLAMTLLLMVGTFTLSFLPPFAVFMYQIIMGDRLEFGDPNRVELDLIRDYLTYRWTAFMLYLLNPMWNFLIYNVRDDQFRRAVHRYATRLWSAMGLKLLRVRLKSESETPTSKNSKTSVAESDVGI